MNELICAKSLHSSGRHSNADQPSTRPRRAAEPNTRHASSSVGPLDTNNLRPMHNQDQAPARTRPLEEAPEGAQHNIHKPGPRRLRRRSAFRQMRSFRPAREEQAISFSFFVLLAVGYVRIHRSLRQIASAMPIPDLSEFLGVTANQARLRLADFHQYCAFMASARQSVGTRPNMDDEEDPNAVPYKVP